LDHGAQFVIARQPRFAQMLANAHIDGVATEWFREGSGDANRAVRWCGSQGMSSLAKWFSRNLNLHLERQAVAVRPVQCHWCVEMEDGSRESARRLVLTAPVPQSLALLERGGFPMAAGVKELLLGIRYDRCLAVLALLDHSSKIPHPGVLVPEDPRIEWIADNQQKGISRAPAVTIHASNSFSQLHWEQDRETAAQEILTAAKPWLGARVKSFSVHGWRYGRPIAVGLPPSLLVEGGPPLVMAGDAFGGSSVEGAALSGWAAADALSADAAVR
jgi:predicted NAD/FAD-dependent oxidoreductase